MPKLTPEKALALHQEAMTTSTSFVDNNYRRQWENNIRYFQSRHETGSKYLSNAYKYRSKIFRPKTRSAIRGKEAAAVAAFFSNQDIVSIEPQNDNDPIQEASSKITKAILQYRLTNSIPWYMICIGGYQDSMVPGVVISYQDWEYEERERKDKQPAIDPDTGMEILDEDGQPAYDTITTSDVIKDRPIVELIPVENIRISPASHWTDPINTSPYFIHLIPMFVIDVQHRMETEDPKTGQPKWNKLSEGEISAAKKQSYDTTRATREKEREDKTDPAGGTDKLGKFDIVWVHRVFMRVDGVDYVFYTLGTEHMLTDPKPIEEVYPHLTAERPYVMGVSVIEAHKTYPDSEVQIGSPIQKELNENASQRSDNIKLVLNKRWFVRRGAQVDLKSILRNAPASITMMNDIERDVKDVGFDDVTSSAFQEQDRLNVDFDEAVGTFSQSSVMSNRKLNETVGGMNMIRAPSVSITEYSLRTFAETWAEPTIKQLVKLIQRYETDDVVLALAADKAQLWQRYGINQVTDRLLNQNLTVSVNVGMGATDPIMKLNHFVMGLKAILEVITAIPPGTPTTLDVIEIAKEIFGYIGFKDGERFFVKSMGEDPEKMQMGQIIQQLQTVIQNLEQQVKDKQMDNQTKLMIGDMKERGADRRKVADVKARLAEKEMDLLNPVAGETPPRKNANQNG